jgi:hypothetical protein
MAGWDIAGWRRGKEVEGNVEGNVEENLEVNLEVKVEGRYFRQDNAPPRSS